MPIRLATDADLDELCRLRLDFIADIRGIDRASFDDAYVATTRAFFVDTMARGVIRSWLASDDHTTDTTVGGDGHDRAGDRNVGIVSVLLADVPPLPERRLVREGYIINLYVSPGARRMGVARALLDTVVAAGPGLGLRGFTLHATDEGRPLYDSAGFTPDSRTMTLPLPAPA